MVGSWALFVFLLGAVPVGPVLARYVADVSLQEQGSGNTGATNVARVVGRYAGLATLLADIAKGVVGAVGGMWATESVGVAGVWHRRCVGHCFTPTCAGGVARGWLHHSVCCSCSCRKWRWT